MGNDEKIGYNPMSEGIPLERELIVIAKREAGLRATREGVASFEGVDVTSLAGLLASEDVSLVPLFGTSEERLKYKAASLAPETGIEVLDLSIYYRVKAPDEKLDELAERFLQLDVIEAAYVKPLGEPPIVPDDPSRGLNDMLPSMEEPPVVTPDFTNRQSYLNPAPVGIDAHYAWNLPGGKGKGIKIIDCEWGWNFTQEDLLQNQMGVVVGTSSPSDNHGTAVLGIISGDHNTFGISGICPEAIVGAASFVGKSSAHTIVEAANKLGPGDILLLEIHRRGPNGGGGGQQGYIAIEWWPDDFLAIRYAISRGIIVVEAAGNGWENLDDPLYDTPDTGFPSWWKNPFNTANPNSGAVMIGAGSPPAGTHGRNISPWNLPYIDRARCGFSNWGERIDAQGWGWEVTSTGYGNLQGGPNRNEWYTDTFSGTSSASPIVVGALGCVQGVLRAQGESLLTAERARTLLRMTGSSQQDAPGRPRTQRIGNRPNLRQLIPSIAKVWHHNTIVRMTYVTDATQSAWAYINELGWRRIKSCSPDSVTNMFQACCTAVANSRNVHIYADGIYIYRVILL